MVDGAMNPGRRWRALALAWVVFLGCVAGGAGLLAWLGPPDAPPAEIAAAPDPATPPPAEAAPPPTPPPAASPGPSPGSSPFSSPGPSPGPERAAPTPEPEPSGSAAAEARGIPAPDPQLLEPGPHGPLPRIGPQGRSSIRAYGRAFDRQDPRPRIAVVIGGLGLNAALTEEAIRRLPATIGLAFSPYAPRVERLLDLARARGMEVLLALPLEPTGYPLNNPGDRALLTGLSEVENQDRLDWAMSRFAGYVGAIGAHGPMRGERFALLPDRLGALQQSLAVRGLLYIDPRPGAAQPARAWGRAVDLLLDEPATRGEIERKLEALERLARERGTALGYAGEPSPVLIERIAAWGGAVEGRGVALAPVTALIRAPAQQGSAAGQARPAPRGN